jgi:hypothetical protein
MDQTLAGREADIASATDSPANLANALGLQDAAKVFPIVAGPTHRPKKRK